MGRDVRLGFEATKFGNIGKVNCSSVLDFQTNALLCFENWYSRDRLTATLQRHEAYDCRFRQCNILSRTLPLFSNPYKHDLHRPGLMQLPLWANQSRRAFRNASPAWHSRAVMSLPSKSNGETLGAWRCVQQHGTPCKISSIHKYM